MYGKHVNSVPNRIASFHQPRLRSIVTWKVKASVEFGAKLDMSVDNGICRLERSSLKLITNPPSSFPLSVITMITKGVTLSGCSRQ